MKIIKLTIIVCFMLATSVLYAQSKQINPDTLVKRLGETFMKGKGFDYKNLSKYIQLKSIN